jgi:hypothetical protein
VNTLGRSLLLLMRMSGEAGGDSQPVLRALSRPVSVETIMLIDIACIEDLEAPYRC